MTNLLRFFLSTQIKQRNSESSAKNKGFTLIELLVGLVLAFLVIIPLLDFMLNIMDTDRKEQARATTEQEIQAALDYIARDVEQAVYIYDYDALTHKSSDNPPGIQNQIPPSQKADGCDSSKVTCEPILVFWKRTQEKQILPVSGCPPTTPSGCLNDAFVYSLVGYYIIKDTNNPTSPWSKAARIGRFEIHDGVVDPTVANSSKGSPTYIQGYGPSPGFALFNLQNPGSDLKSKMNQWQKNSTASYADPVTVLVDYIDQSPFALPRVNLANLPGCPVSPSQQQLPLNQQQPNHLIYGSMFGFFTCVIDPNNALAQIYIYGNAIARIQNDPSYTKIQSRFFPKTTLQVKGRGFLSADTQ